MAGENEALLLDLLNKLGKFINGGADEYVTTDNGEVPSLLAISKQARATRFVLEAISFPTKLALKQSLDNGAFIEGQVARVYKDPQIENNGFYQVDPANPNEVLKSDLVDLYGLGPRDSGSTTAVIGADDIGKKSVARFRYISSPIDPFIQHVRYEIDVKCRRLNNRFLRSYSGTLLVSHDTTNGLKFSRQTEATNTLLIDPGASPSNELALTPSLESGGAADILNLKVMSTDLPGFDFTGYVVTVRLTNLHKDTFINT